MTDSRPSSPFLHQLLLVLLLLGLLLATAIPARGAVQDSWSLRDIVRRVEPAVVWVVAEISENELSQGSGFIVREDGYVLTNAHVVEGASRVTIGWPDRFNRSDRQAEIIALDTDLDMALLRVPAAHLPALPLDTSGSASLGDAVITLGFPAGEELGLGGLTVTRGVVSCIRYSDDGETSLIQTDAAVTLGCSGGPLYDLDTNAVIGMIQGKGMFLLEGYNFAVPIANFFEFSGTAPGDGAEAAVAQLTGEIDDNFSEPALRALEAYYQGLLARGQADWAEALGHFLAATQVEDEDPQTAYSAAESYAALDQPRQALRWLERAFELGFTDFDGALDAPGFRGVRDDSRFVDLVQSF